MYRKRFSFILWQRNEHKLKVMPCSTFGLNDELSLWVKCRMRDKFCSAENHLTDTFQFLSTRSTKGNNSMLKGNSIRSNLSTSGNVSSPENRNKSLWSRKSALTERRRKWSLFHSTCLEVHWLGKRRTVILRHSSLGDMFSFAGVTFHIKANRLTIQLREKVDGQSSLLVENFQLVKLAEERSVGRINSFEKMTKVNWIKSRWKEEPCINQFDGRRNRLIFWQSSKICLKTKVHHSSFAETHDK